MDRLVELGILTPQEPDRFTPGDVRRVQMARSLEDAGIPLGEVVTAIERGALSLGFADAAGFERFAGLTDQTFHEVSDRTGVPLELLAVVREAIGMPPPSPEDLGRLRYVEVVTRPLRVSRKVGDVVVDLTSRRVDRNPLLVTLHDVPQSWPRSDVEG